MRRIIGLEVASRLETCENTCVVDGLNRLFVMKGCDCVAHTLVVHSHWHMAWILTQGWLSAQAMAGIAYTVSWVRIITPRFT